MGNLSQAYGTVAAMCASATPYADASLATEIIFERMPSVVPKHRQNLIDEDMAVRPDLDILNSALLACARAEGGSQMKEMDALVQEMKALKIRPSVTTLNYLILGCANFCGH